MPSNTPKKLKIFSNEDLKKIHSQIEEIDKGFKCLLCGYISGNKSRLSNKHFLKEHRNFLNENNIPIPKNWENLFYANYNKKEVNSELITRLIGEYIILSGQSFDKLDHYSMKYFVTNSFCRIQTIPSVEQSINQYLPQLYNNMMNNIGNFIKHCSAGTLCLNIYNDLECYKQVINGTLCIPNQQPLLLFSNRLNLDTKIDYNTVYQIIINELSKWEQYTSIYSKIIAIVYTDNEILSQVILKLKEHFLKEKMPLIYFPCFNNILINIIKKLVNPEYELLPDSIKESCQISSKLFNTIKTFIKLYSNEEVFIGLFNLSHDINSDIRPIHIKYENDEKIFEYINNILIIRPLLLSLNSQQTTIKYPKEFIDIINDNNFWNSIEHLSELSQDLSILLNRFNNLSIDLSSLSDLLNGFLNKIQEVISTSSEITPEVAYSRYIYYLFEECKIIPWSLLTLSRLLDPDIPYNSLKNDIFTPQSIDTIIYEVLSNYFKCICDNSTIELFKTELNNEIERKRSIDLPTCNVEKYLWWKEQVLHYNILKDIGSIIFSCLTNVYDAEKSYSIQNPIIQYSSMRQDLLSDLLLVRINGERAFTYDDSYGIKQEDLNNLHELLNKSIMNSSYIEQNSIIENVKRILNK